MVRTRSQARSRQPLDQVASSGACPPRRVISQTSGTPQQPSPEGGVEDSSVYNTGAVGGRSASSAAGSDRSRTRRNCRADCKTCPSLVRDLSIKSSFTGRIYHAIDVDLNNIHCKLQNYIYVLKCSSCHVQYVGESIVPLNLRMNIHRRGKSGCEVSIDHYKNVCPGATFSIQVLEKLPGDGYKNGKMDLAMLKYRLEREDYWMKTLRTVYPYGLNDKTKMMNRNLPVGKLYPPLPRHGTRFLGKRTRSSKKCRISNLDSLVHSIFSYHVENRTNKFRILLNQLKHSNLKQLAVEASSLLSVCDDTLRRWYELTIDIFLTKSYIEKKVSPKKSPKHILPTFFHNKGLELIKLNKIIQSQDVSSILPETLQCEDPPSIVYSLASTIRNKIFNYKETINSLKLNKDLSFDDIFPSCDCHSSSFVDPDHGHIITGDLRIIENKHLRKLISKGPNYREPKTINWNKCRESIGKGLDAYCATMSTKFALHENDIFPWKNAVLKKVESKIALLKQKMKYNKVKPTLDRPEVKEYLQNLQSKFVFVPIDKAANNVALVCKRFYVETILNEIGILGEGNPTYVSSELPKESIIEDNIQYSQRLRMEPTDKELDLPIMYWTPKMHKTPTGKRFIIASKQCSTKKISTAVSLVFKMIFSQVESFHKNAKFLSNYNKFWVLQNSNPILEVLDQINKKKNAKSISTFDFSTLYTKLPHDKLIKELSGIIDFVFDAGSCQYIAISKHDKAYWTSKKPTSSVFFSKNSLKIALKHLIQNCFFTVGIFVMKQVIGIPMGIDPAPFWANLFLYQYELRYMETLISEDKVKARHFHSTKRFIDDLCAINDGALFERVYRDIYPDELELKKEHSGQHATFLNLDITIKEGIFVYKLYDKRDSFPFSIVRMPHLDSNIPESIFYSALVGEFLRIARSTLFCEDFVLKAIVLCQRMHSQGANSVKMKQSLHKIITRHPNDFSRFQPTDALIEKLLCF